MRMFDLVELKVEIKRESGSRLCVCVILIFNMNAQVLRLSILSHEDHFFTVMSPAIMSKLLPSGWRSTNSSPLLDR